MATIYPIVEGHGEVASVPKLLGRMGVVIAPEQFIKCLPPHRLPRNQLLDPIKLGHALAIAIKRLRSCPAPAAILILMDADDDRPAELVRQLKAQHQAQFDAMRHSIVFAVREIEAWFLAANMTQAAHPDLRPDCPVIEFPEQVADAKGAFAKRILPDGIYTSSVDQVRFVSKMDLQAARRAPSFDKLWRDMEVILGS